MAELDVSEWKGKNAVNIKSVLGKEMTICGEKDFVKPAVRNGKKFMATYHIVYAIDKASGEKIKVFGTGVLCKIINDSKDKCPFDNSIEFVAGKGKYRTGYYKLSKPVLKTEPAKKTEPAAKPEPEKKQ